MGLAQVGRLIGLDKLSQRVYFHDIRLWLWQWSKLSESWHNWIDSFWAAKLLQFNEITKLIVVAHVCRYPSNHIFTPQLFWFIFSICALQPIYCPYSVALEKLVVASLTTAPLIKVTKDTLCVCEKQALLLPILLMSLGWLVMPFLFGVLWAGMSPISEEACASLGEGQEEVY